MKSIDLFTTDQDTKTIIKEISTLFGIKNSIVSEILQYMYFTWILQLSENPDKIQSITIPYLGRVGIKINDEPETALVLNDNFKTLLSEIKDRDLSSLTDFFKQKINTIIG